MIPTVVLIGHPNVGKSTLFNRLTLTRDALVADIPRLTRDRKYGFSEIKGCSFIVIDTGGFYINEKGIIEQSIMKQSLLAIEEADIILFIVDARVGLIPADHDIANYLRSINKVIFLVVNKVDGLDPSIAILDFYTLGLSEIYPITASHGKGIKKLLEMALLPWLKRVTQQNVNENNKSVYQHKKEEKFKEGALNLIDLPIKLAVVGRPNVGKSTLINRFLEKERIIVYDRPGTTIDNIYIPIEHNSNKYILIDTAGIRKQSNITESIEKFAVIKTLKAIKDSNVVILMIDALSSISDQDLSLINFIFNNGRSLVIVFNKWDQLSQVIKKDIRKSLNYRFSFFNFARVHFVSALYGSKQSITNIFKSINETYNYATKHVNTSMLTNIMNMAINDHQPPIINGRRVKLKYAHAGGYNPPIIVIHGNQVKNLPSTYQRYLVNYFRSSLNIIGTPIHLFFKEGENPYLGKRNLLTRTQQRKRKRLIGYIKH